MAVQRVLAITGSPRLGGNTESLVDRILEGARAAGAEIKKAVLTEMNVSPCRGCDSCTESRKCVIPDDLSFLKDEMTRSDVWILGTPVYYAGPTAQFKAFMDRWYGMDREIFKDKKVIVAVPLGDNPEIAQHLVGMFQTALEFQGTQSPEFLVVPFSFELGSVLQNAEIMEKAYRIGLTAAQAS